MDIANTYKFNWAWWRRMQQGSKETNNQVHATRELRTRPKPKGPNLWWSWFAQLWHLLHGIGDPLWDARSVGQGVTVFMNMLFRFVIAQGFLSMMCHLKYGIFFLFSAWVLAMSLFTMLLIPETKNIPLQEMTENVWRNHLFWKSFMD